MFSQRVQDMKPSGIRKFFSLAAKMEKCLDLSIGQPHFDVPDSLKLEAQSAISNGRNAYTPSLGIESARNAVKSKYNISNNSNFDVIITSGVSGGLLLVYAALLDEGDEILIPDPYFVGYKEIAVMLKAKPVIFDTYPDFVPRPEKLEKLVTNKTKAIVIGSPSNPTGYVLTKAELDALVNFAKQKNIYLIFDEIYEAFSYDTPHIRPELDEKIIILNGLSKSHAMTGWRLGWVVANKDLVDQLQKVQQFSFVCAPAPFQQIIPAALNYSDNSIFESYKSRRDRVVKALSSKFEIVNPGGAFYVFPRVDKVTASEFVESAIKNSVLVIPGTVFSTKDTHFRLSFAVKDEVLDEALEVLAKI